MDYDHPERTVLPLPSRLSAAKRSQYKLEDMVVVDIMYRQVQMDAFLTDCRSIIFDQEAGYRAKDAVTGQRWNTRLGIVVNSFKIGKECARGQYNHSRTMLLNLVEKKSDYSHYKVLNREDMYCRLLQREKKLGVGEAGKRTNWLWRTQKPGSLDDEEEMQWQKECELPR